MPEAEVRAAFEAQAAYCDGLGSPFTARLCRLVARRLDTTSDLGAAVLGWQGQPDAKHDVLALRLMGGLHQLVLERQSQALADVYPPHAEPDDERLWAVVRDALLHHGATLVAGLRSAPQTNEVRRSALLMAGAAVIAAETGLPIELNELGASAGLNLIFDRYEHNLGGQLFGTPGSPVRLTPEWKGPAPAPVQPKIVAARGVDLNPLRIDREADRTRLLSYTWADQADRLARSEAAIALASNNPPILAAADAADWLERLLCEPQPEGVVRVVTHTIAVQYFPESSQRRIAELLADAGHRATRRTPLARLGFELPPDGSAAELALTVWPDGTSRTLAHADPHGGTIRWLGPEK